MSAQKTGLRRALTLTYAEGENQRERIKVSGYVRRLICRLSGTIGVSGNGTNVMNLDPEAILPSVNVWLNGEQLLHSGRFYDFRIRQGAFGKLGTRDQVGATVTSGGAPYAFSSLISLPFETPNAMMPQDSILALPSSNDLELEVTWGTPSSLINGGTLHLDGSNSSVVPTLKVIADVVRVAKPPTHLYRTGAFDSDALGTSANTELEISIPKSSKRNYHHMILSTEDVNNAAGGGRRPEAVTLNDIILRQESGGIESNILGPISGVEAQEEFDEFAENQNGIQTGIFPFLFQGRHHGKNSFNVQSKGLTELKWILDHGTFGTDGRVRTLWGVVEELK